MLDPEDALNSVCKKTFAGTTWDPSPLVSVDKEPIEDTTVAKSQPARSTEQSMNI